MCDQIKSVCRLSVTGDQCKCCERSRVKGEAEETDDIESMRPGQLNALTTRPVSVVRLCVCVWRGVRRSDRRLPDGRITSATVNLHTKVHVDGRDGWGVVGLLSEGCLVHTPLLIQ